jgi:superfamily I DNA/RNA helicase/mRNA-degrading endonuclease RelE of RelBE toxin-antitoxin system
MSDEYTIGFDDGFFPQLRMLPKKVWNSLENNVFPTLRKLPDSAVHPKIKRLKGIKRFWRFEVGGKYRLIYEIDHSDRVVSLRRIGDRKDVYKSLGILDNGKPGANIIVNSGHLLEEEPTSDQIEEAMLNIANDKSDPNIAELNQDLPRKLSTKFLMELGVHQKYHLKLIQAQTESDLLSLEPEVSHDTLLLILHALYPPNLQEVSSRPIRIIDESDSLEEIASGNLNLETLLLKLDGEQEAYVSRFRGNAPKGPWLLKGGPGSGKTTVALYCIKTILDNESSQLKLSNDPPKILLTTYTKSLTGASEQLLSHILQPESINNVSMKTIHSLAYEFTSQNMRDKKLKMNPSEYIQNILGAATDTDRFGSFSATDTEFVKDEIEEVIVGQQLTSLEQYLTADRSGRGLALGQNQRRHIWTIYEELKNQLRKENACLLGDRMEQALANATPQFDFVFIDEAQDLSPLAIRLCVRLCKDASKVFVTADTNQSIYGNGLSWSKVASELNFAGKARILRRNYRTTIEIWKAISSIAPSGEGVDRETLEIEAAFNGPAPKFVTYGSSEDLRVSLNNYMHESLKEERLPYSCGAIICPSKREMKLVSELLDQKFKAKIMSSNDMDIGYPGVKILTMHATKGLQFPVVAVLGLEKDKMPVGSKRTLDKEQHLTQQQRLLFVACSRAMRRLSVFGNRENPSSFASFFEGESWDLENT